MNLEPLRAAHAASLWSALQAPEIYAWIPESPPASVAALRARYETLVRGAPVGSGERWLNWVLTRAGEPIGTLQATIERRARRASIAYVLFPPHQGKGFAVEGVRLMLAALAGGGEVDVVAAEIDTRNTRSIALVERLGFELIRHEPTEVGRDGVHERSLRDLTSERRRSEATPPRPPP